MQPNFEHQPQAKSTANVKASYGIVILLIIATGILAYTILAKPLNLNHDATLNLEIGRYLLEGRIPYLDYYEINPPLVQYLNILPAYISQVTSINPITVYLLLMFVTVMYIAWLSYRLGYPIIKSNDGLIAYLIPLIIIIISLETRRDFGQRDHLVVLLLIPYLLLRILRWEKHTIGITSVISIGVMAGLGLGIKPYFAISVIVVEVYGLLRYRQIRTWFTPEVIIIGVIGFAYIGHFWLLPITAREHFFGVLLPEIIANYDSYNLTLDREAMGLATLFLIPHTLWLTLVIIVLSITLILRSHYGYLIYPFGLFAIASWWVFWVQQAHFTYHAMPFVFSAVITVAFATFLPLSSRGVVGRGIVLSMLAITLIYIRIPSTPYAPPSEHIMQEYSEIGDTVFFIDTTGRNIYPLITQLERKNEASYLFGFPIPFALYPLEDPNTIYEDGAFPDLLERYLVTLANDIEQHQPSMIFVRTDNCRSCPVGFNIHTFLDVIGFLDTHIRPTYVTIDASMPHFVIYVRATPE